MSPKNAASKSVSLLALGNSATCSRANRSVSGLDVEQRFAKLKALWGRRVAHQGITPFPRCLLAFDECQWFLVVSLKQLARKGNVTLMCHCGEDQEQCHRHLLQTVILSKRV